MLLRDYRSEKRVNPFRRIYESEVYANARATCPEFPLLVDIETTNKCNLNCVFCDRQLMRRALGEMSFNFFMQIADKMTSKVKGLRFSGWGEPFLNKEIYKMFAYAKERGFLVHVTTNGLAKYFYPDKLENVDSINFSMQGLTEEEYLKMRRNRMWNKLVENIKKTMAVEKRPYVTLATTVLDETDKEMDEFVEEWKGAVDRVQVGLTSFDKVREKLNKEEILSEKEVQRQAYSGRKTKCNMPWINLEVDWDGKVGACCTDYDNLLYVGDFSKSSLEHIWRGSKILAIRKMINEGKQDKHPLCSKCGYQF